MNVTKKRLIQAGFSLVTGAIGMGVMGFLGLSFYSAFISDSARHRATREYDEATGLMTRTLDAIGQFPWERVTTPGFIPERFVTSVYDPAAGSPVVPWLTFTGAIEVAAAPVNADFSNSIRQVTVSLTWSSGPLVRRHSLSTLVAKDGLPGMIY
jgi:hypothetical protein